MWTTAFASLTLFYLCQIIFASKCTSLILPPNCCPMTCVYSFDQVDACFTGSVNIANSSLIAPCFHIKWLDVKDFTKSLYSRQFYKFTSVRRIGAGSENYRCFGDSQLQPDARSATPTTAWCSLRLSRTWGWLISEKTRLKKSINWKWKLTLKEGKVYCMQQNKVIISACMAHSCIRRSVQQAVGANSCKKYRLWKSPDSFHRKWLATTQGPTRALGLWKYVMRENRLVKTPQIERSWDWNQSLQVFQFHKIFIKSYSRIFTSHLVLRHVRDVNSALIVLRSFGVLGR